MKEINKQADIGVFGGSGFYSFLEDVEEIEIETPYGMPSDKISIAKVNGKKVAFLPRHGKTHSIPPHKVNYRANIYAMKMLGVKAIISPCSAGSLQKEIQPGDFVITDQYVDRTYGRECTFFDGPQVKHLSSVTTYDENLRKIAIEAAKELGISVHESGTMVVVQGPRFSSIPESKWYTQMGWHTINMTQYPEAYLAQEQEIPVVNVALITDYDAGLVSEDGKGHVTEADVYKVFHDNIQKVKDLIFKMIESWGRT